MRRSIDGTLRMHYGRLATPCRNTIARPNMIIGRSTSRYTSQDTSKVRMRINAPEAAVAHLRYEKARDVVAGLPELDHLCRSVQRAVRPDRSARGRDLASRCQNIELMRGGRRRGYRRLLVDVGGAKHTSLHRRDRQARGFESRTFRSGCDRRARDCEGGGYDGQRNLGHLEAPLWDSSSTGRRILLQCNKIILRRTSI